MNSFDTQVHPEDDSAILAYEGFDELSELESEARPHTTLRQRIAAMPQYPTFYTKDGERTNTNELLGKALDAFADAFCVKLETESRPVSLKRLEERQNAQERAWFDEMSEEMEEQAERDEKDARLALYASQQASERPIQYDTVRQDLIDANYVAFGRMLELAEETGRTL
jgi:hypothetical protein